MTKMAQAIHMIRRYSPVRVTIIPERAEKTAAPRENGNILCNEKYELFCVSAVDIDGRGDSLDTGTRSRRPEDLEVKWKIVGTCHGDATESENSPSVDKDSTYQRRMPLHARTWR